MFGDLLVSGGAGEAAQDPLPAAAQLVLSPSNDPRSFSFQQMEHKQVKAQLIEPAASCAPAEMQSLPRGHCVLFDCS